MYKRQDLYYFMDNETFEQIPLNESELGDAFKFVKENEVCKVLSYKGKVCLLYTSATPWASRSMKTPVTAPPAATSYSPAWS